MGCPGCGGKGKSPGETFGHILGCGEPTAPARADTPGPGEHWNAFGMVEQREILRSALKKSGLDPKVVDTKLVDAFSKELRVLLEEHSLKCANAKPAECMHVPLPARPS